MQQADAKTMAILLKGIEEYDVEKIRVIFKQENRQDAPILKEEYWSADGSGTAGFTGQVLTVKWSIEDTFLFEQDKYFYIGFQIFVEGREDMPSVKTKEVYMSDSLFSESEALEND